MQRKGKRQNVINTLFCSICGKVNMRKRAIRPGTGLQLLNKQIDSILPFCRISKNSSEEGNNLFELIL